MMILASMISGAPGGIQGVNRLVLDAAHAAGLEGAVVALHDAADADWVKDWPYACCAGGSRFRFALGALSRRRHARRSVVLVTHVALAPVGRLVKELVGGRLCLFLHGQEVWRPLALAAHWGLKAFDGVLANSHFTLRRFREVNPLFAGLAGDVCYLPARELARVPTERLLAAPRPRLRVLIVGRLWGRGLSKGQCELISVWPEILREFPGAELWVVGEGAGRLDLERLVAGSGGQAVRFTGEVSDAELDALYAASDVYAMPSEGEGFGLVFAEAMAHGLPCIASRLDAGGEVVVDGETGYVIDPRSQEELRNALRCLLANPALRRKMGEAGRRRADELFSLAAFTERITGFLQGALLGG